MKSDNKTIQAISAQAHGEAADNRLLRKKLKEEYARQLDKMSAEFAARLAAKQNEINALKGEDGGTDGN